MNKKTMILTSFLMILGVVFYSCEKETDGPSTDDVQLAIDDAIVTAAFDDLSTFVTEAESDYQTKSAVISDDKCYDDTVFIDGNVLKVIIDFHDGCTDLWGNTRKGKIVATFTKFYRQEGYTHTITLEDYYINDYQVEGMKTVTNTGENEDGNIEFSVTISDGKLTTPEGVEITRESTRTREWIEGESTLNVWDDKYEITGEATGINFKGNEYTRTITQSLVISASCRFPLSGVIESQDEEGSIVTLDYGAGDCDNKATVTKDGISKEILLRMKRRGLK